MYYCFSVPCAYFQFLTLTLWTFVNKSLEVARWNYTIVTTLPSEIEGIPAGCVIY